MLKSVIVKKENGNEAAINFAAFKNGMVVVNSTPHPITMQDMDTGELVSVPTSELINAKVEETMVSDFLVKSVFVATPEGEETINMFESIFEQEFPKERRLIIIGSIIAAQAYPGRVFGMTPVPGFERVPPAEKRMRNDKFVTF
jgi:hypothetical protein